MRDWIFVINGGAVSLFGCILAASFCGVLKDKRKRLTVYLGMAALLLGQGLAYILFGGEWVRRLYPLIAHLPLWMMLYFLSKDVFWSLFSVLFAYLCCQLRRWTALLITTVFAGDAFVQNLSELILTVPVLIVLLETVSPVMRGLSGVPLMEKCKLFVLPALYYAFDYATQIYAKSLIMEYPVVSEFMPFVCCLLYLTFLLYDSAGKRVKNEMRQVQHGLDIQLNQAVRQISAMRESQERARQYRHDLRHHLQYVSACIRNGQNDTALEYIGHITGELETQKVVRYCENETVNLILSAFAGRAEKLGIALDIQGNLPADGGISDSDLCVLFSNAIENALHAAAEVKNPEIRVRFYIREGKFFLQITNSCRGNVRFEHGIPVSDRPGHGIGVQSICAMVHRNGGICSFEEKDGQFILRLSI